MAKNSKLILFFVFASLVGIISGVFGGGGGIICVPILKLILGLDDKASHATTILITAIISIPTAIVYITHATNVSPLCILFLIVGVLCGGLIGSAVLKKASEDFISIVFIILLLFAGIKILV